MIRWRWLRQAVAPLLNQPRTERGMEYRGALQVLDAGSGNGDFAFRLARRYARATIHGVDMDGEHVAACQARLGATPLRNLTFAQADLTESVGTKVYDLIYSVDVLEHISDDQAALANLARALRPGGRLIIHTPLTPQHHWLRRFDLERCPRADHVRQGYNEEDLQAKVRASGLEITSVRHTHGRWGTLAWELWMLARPYPLAKVLLWPLARLLISLEMASPSNWHNCILLQARLSPQAVLSGGPGLAARLVGTPSSFRPTASASSRARRTACRGSTARVLCGGRRRRGHEEVRCSPSFAFALSCGWPIRVLSACSEL